MLTFTVTNQTLTRTDEFSPASDSLQYLTASFTFSDDWTAQPVAIFEGSGVRYEAAIIDGVCTVPWEVLAERGYVIISCYAEYDSHRVTTNTAKFYNAESNYGSAENTTPPTQELYQQLIDHIEDVQDAVEQSEQNAEDSATDAATAARAAEGFADDAETASEHYPRIYNGTWWLWNPSTSAWIDTGTQAQGPQGEQGETGNVNFATFDIVDGELIMYTDEPMNIDFALDNNGYLEVII